MKRFLPLILLAVVAFGQTSNYPASLDTDASLFITADNQQSYLTAAMQTGDSVAVVASGAGFVANQIITICDTQLSSGPMSGKCTAWEHMKVTAVNGNQLTVTRGVNGTSARAHAVNKPVSVPITSGHQKAMKDALIAIETLLGPNGSNMIPAGSLPVSFGSATGTAIPGHNNPYTTPNVFSLRDGTAASPQTSGAKPTFDVQRANASPSGITQVFGVDCFSTSAAKPGFSGGCIAATNVIHDLTIARGGIAGRNTAYSDAPAATSALTSAVLSGTTVTVTTGSAHYAAAGEDVIISGTSGMTGLNARFTVVTAPDSTHLTVTCGGCSGGPGTGGTVVVPVYYYASWDSAWRMVGNVRVVGRESDMNNIFGDAGDDIGGAGATYNDALYCSNNKCTVGMLIGSGDGGTGQYYFPLKFNRAVVNGYPFIDTSDNNLSSGADFAWIGYGQYLKWMDVGGGRWKIIGMNSGGDTNLSAANGQTIKIGPNMTNVLEVGANYARVANAVAFAGLAACAAGTKGQYASITDSSTVTWGATITGGGANAVLGWCNGTNWTVVGK